MENNKENIEAIPGPAIAISRQEWQKLNKKMKQNAKRTQKQLEKYKALFETINKKSKNNEPEEQGPSL